MDIETILQHISDAGFATNHKGSITGWSSKMESLLGRDARQVLGKPCHEVICGRNQFDERVCRGRCDLRKGRDGEEFRGVEFRLRTAAGEQVPFRCSVMAICEARESTPAFHIVHLLEPLESSRSSTTESSHASADYPDTSLLTRRELETLKLLAEGVDTQRIAKSLFVSVSTVRSHVRSILQKLGVHSQLQAVVLAYRRQLF